MAQSGIAAPPPRRTLMMDDGCCCCCCCCCCCWRRMLPRISVHNPSGRARRAKQACFALRTALCATSSLPAAVGPRLSAPTAVRPLPVFPAPLIQHQSPPCAACPALPHQATPCPGLPQAPPLSPMCPCGSVSCCAPRTRAPEPAPVAIRPTPPAHLASPPSNPTLDHPPPAPRPLQTPPPHRHTPRPRAPHSAASTLRRGHAWGRAAEDVRGDVQQGTCVLGHLYGQRRRLAPLPCPVPRSDVNDPPPPPPPPPHQDHRLASQLHKPSIKNK